MSDVIAHPLPDGRSHHFSPITSPLSPHLLTHTPPTQPTTHPPTLSQRARQVEITRALVQDVGIDEESQPPAAEAGAGAVGGAPVVGGDDTQVLPVAQGPQQGPQAPTVAPAGAAAATAAAAGAGAGAGGGGGGGGGAGAGTGRRRVLPSYMNVIS